MLLTKIILSDYGVYGGKHEFDLTCSVDKPVILIGGTNGAGKTTLFESVMLCLYGMSYMGRRCTRKTYEEFLLKKIHKSTRAKFASITIQFKFFHAGQETEYKVNRMWQKTDGELEERLFVHKWHADRQEFLSLDIVEESYWQSFIKDLIPKGVANLFFFDGEKIVDIAKEEKEDFAIKESFKSLLGLDIVEQLCTDLQVNMVKNLTKGGNTLQEDYEKLKSEKESHQSSNIHLDERLAQKQNELDQLQMKIDSMESNISKIGGEFAFKRETVKEQLVKKQSEYSHIEKSIQENCSNYLPFSMIPNILHEIKSIIELDQSILQERFSHQAILSEINDIKSEIISQELWNEHSNMREKILVLLEQRIRPFEDKQEIFGFSTTQIAKILQTVDNANNSSLNNLYKDTKELIIISEEIQKLERTLTSAASDDEVGELVSQLGVLNRRFGELRKEMDHIEEKISNNTAMCRHIDSKLRQIVTQMYDNEKSITKVTLTKNVQIVLDEFLEEIKKNKLRLLEQYLLENIQLLARKRQFIENVTIDPDTFKVKLFGVGKQQIPKDVLSEGEKQMFATAILWALAKVSGKPLPFLIDTPLARLDASHRLNIVSKFFPIASHQTIIFSTDKEIEQEHYEMLKPYITRSYVVEFSEDDASARCYDGYFWNDKGEKIIAV